MQITRTTRTKYYLLSLLGTLVVALGVLAVAPSAQAQVDPTLSIDKECNPDPVQLGQQITCTILVETGAGPAFFRVLDTFPAGLTVTEATSTFLVDGDPVGSTTTNCSMEGNTVTCPPQEPFEGFFLLPDPRFSIEVTIEATAQQCGTFLNTATAEQISGSTVSDTEEITVDVCEVPPEPGQQQPNQQQGAPPAPITQDFEQDSEAGEIDQTFDIS